MASESRPSQPFALFAAHIPGSEQDAPMAAAWGWSSLPLPDAEPTAYPAAVREALADVATTVLQVAPTTPPTNVGCEAVVLHRRGRTGGGHLSRPGRGSAFIHTREALQPCMHAQACMLPPAHPMVTLPSAPCEPREAQFAPACPPLGMQPLPRTPALCL